MEKYKVIQSLNTFGGEESRLHPGFSSKREMIQFMKRSYETLSKFNYTIYTDNCGRDMLDFIDAKHIEVFDFKLIDDRIPYIGKFQVQEIQNEPYIHIDLDSILYKLPDTNDDILTERLRHTSFGEEIVRLDIDVNGIEKIICSGLIGFNDIDFKNKYISEVYRKIEYIKNERNLRYREFYTLEETLLSRLQIDNNKTIHEVPSDIFKHHYGNINKTI